MSGEREPRWVEKTFTLSFDLGTYYGDPERDDALDAEEIAYLLRMGGIDAKPAAPSERAVLGGKQ